MQAYIALTYAPADREAAECLTATLCRYGFRLRALDADTSAEHRSSLLRGAACLIAITSPAACTGDIGGSEACTPIASNTPAADMLAFATARDLPRRPILCVSTAPSALDALNTQWATAAMEDAGMTAPDAPDDLVSHVAYVDGDTQAIWLLLHRVAICHLCRLPETLCDAACAADHPSGRDRTARAVALAVKAHAGDPEAAYALAKVYEEGDGLPRLEVEAARWMAPAAAAGLSDARIRMGELYLTGRGTNTDVDAAYRLFAAASKDGDPRGDYHLGLSYLYGQGVMRDADLAAHFLTAAARAGYPPALYRLALLYRDGIGVTKNTRAAIRLLYQACLIETNTSADAPSDLPGLYHPCGVRPRRAKCVTLRQLRRSNLAHRLPHLTQAKLARCFDRSHLALLKRELVIREDPAAKLTDRNLMSEGGSKRFYTAGEGHSDCASFTAAEAATALGLLLENGSPAECLHPHPTRALVWYRFALHHGYAEAEYRLGDAYRRGIGAPADAARAVLHYRKAADRGEDRARFALGVCYERGIGVPRNAMEAARHYEIAARAGYAPAQNNLGGCYEQGIGVVQNQITAVEWYTRAAAQDQPDATCRLGLCYESGRGVVADAVRAYRLYEAAAHRNHPYALYRLGLCYQLGVNTRHLGQDKNTASDLQKATEDAHLDASLPSYDLPDGESVIIEPDYAKAVRLFTDAANGGVPDAAYALSLCYEHGCGTPPDDAAALTYLRRAAEGGHIQATCHLGLCYLEGHGTVRNIPAALACFARTAALKQAREEAARRQTRNGETEMLPLYATTPGEAAGTALYMLGYCALEGLDTAEGVANESSSRTNSDNASTQTAAQRAADYFRRAAELDHIGALTALGDLCAHGLLAHSAAAADEALDYYHEAAELAAHTGAHAADRVNENSPIHALMSLADRSLNVAREAEAEGDPGSAELARVRAWRCLAGCAELGSVDALVSMAACAHFGHGTPKNQAASLWFLRRAAGLSGETISTGASSPSGTQAAGQAHALDHSTVGPYARVSASLYLGDLLWCGAADPTESGIAVSSASDKTDECPLSARYEAADEAYLRALKTPYTDTECGPFTPSVRRMARREEDNLAHAEACYHMAVLRAVHLSVHPTRHAAFPYLAKAVLLGHTAAREDLARMYDYEIAYIAATASATKADKKATRAERRALRAARASALAAEKNACARTTDTPKDPRAARSHAGWLGDYYTALWPTPTPFSATLEATSVPSDRPEYLSRPVTPAMLASSLNHLADCYFEGRDLEAHPSAAVSLWREVVSMPAGELRQVPALAWAHYSLGWCLLHGVGVQKNATEAVYHLSCAARTHAEASYTLGTCHEEGIGVDVPDDREAIKFYRRAARLGYTPAEDKVDELVARLKNK